VLARRVRQFTLQFAPPELVAALSGDASHVADFRASNTAAGPKYAAWLSLTMAVAAGRTPPARLVNSEYQSCRRRGLSQRPS
jgi:hypothetical protein